LSFPLLEIAGILQPAPPPPFSRKPPLDSSSVLYIPSPSVDGDGSTSQAASSLRGGSASSSLDGQLLVLHRRPSFLLLPFFLPSLRFLPAPAKFRFLLSFRIVQEGKEEGPCGREISTPRSPEGSETHSSSRGFGRWDLGRSARERQDGLRKVCSLSASIPSLHSSTSDLFISAFHQRRYQLVVRQDPARARLCSFKEENVTS